MFDRAVVNAGPLVALSLLDQLDLLPALFAECWVPQAVFNEVAVAGIGKPGAKSLQGADWQARVRASPFPDPYIGDGVGCRRGRGDQPGAATVAMRGDHRRAPWADFRCATPFAGIARGWLLHRR